MPADGQYDRNVQHILTKLLVIKLCRVSDGSTYVDFETTLCHATALQETRISYVTYNNTYLPVNFSRVQLTPVMAVRWPATASCFTGAPGKAGSRLLLRQKVVPTEALTQQV